MNKALIILVCSIQLTACATIVNHPTQLIPVNSNPAGASVKSNCGKQETAPVVTPTVITVKRHSEPCNITISKAGYQDVTVALDKTISGVYWVNLLLGGIPGFIVDAVTGAMFRRVPDTVTVQLQQK